MRYSQLLGKTLREDPKEAEFASHRLLLKAGFITQLSSGIYNFLPLGYRVLNKISNVIREELDDIGCQEVLMPTLSPKSIWEESGRWTKMDNLLKVTDKHEHEFAMGPTHEEIITDIARGQVKSHKDLPFTAYQISPKFRDETRFKGGLMRGKEFHMKDAYSFHSTEEDLEKRFDEMANCYRAIFSRLELEAIDVAADAGSIGGTGSREFIAPLEIGEDTIIVCEKCDYRSNVEAAICELDHANHEEDTPQPQEVDTPNTSTIEDVCKFFDIQANKTSKNILYKVGDIFVLAVIRGDLEVNETKLQNILQAQKPAEEQDKAIEMRMASDEEIKELGLVKGYINAQAAAQSDIITIIADPSVTNKAGYTTGGNKEGKHIINVVFDRDWKTENIHDITTVVAGHACPECKGPLAEKKGVELGHIFRLGTAYSQRMKAQFANKDNTTQDITMGCYGIGVSRLIAAIAEGSHDEGGLIWPKEIAPYQVHLISIGKSDELKEAADKLYEDLRQKGIEVLFDDRAEGPGSKFKDADLIGIPHRVVISEKLIPEGKLEWKARTQSESSLITEVEMYDKLSQ